MTAQLLGPAPAASLALVLLLCGAAAAVALGAELPTPDAASASAKGKQPTALQPAAAPRFAQVQSAGSAAERAAASIAASAASHDEEGERSHAGARAGGEWWVKDPPWFLPPPPEWGPMPPTMYTSFFHKPRYPALSTANYYPLYTREDEYDAHLPASMSRRAAHTQQMIYDHYVATYRDHMNGGPHAPLAVGDPNFGVRNPALFGHLGGDAALSGAHTAAVHAQYPNNYFAGGFSGGPDHGPGSFVNGGAGGYGGAMALAGAFLEVQGTRLNPRAAREQLMSHSLQGERAVTYFASDVQPQFIQTDAAVGDADDAEDEDEDDEEEKEEEQAGDEEEQEQEQESEDGDEESDPILCLLPPHLC